MWPCATAKKRASDCSQSMSERCIAWKENVRQQLELGEVCVWQARASGLSVAHTLAARLRLPSLRPWSRTVLSPVTQPSIVWRQAARSYKGIWYDLGHSPSGHCAPDVSLTPRLLHLLPDLQYRTLALGRLFLYLLHCKQRLGSLESTIHIAISTKKSRLASCVAASTADDHVE